MAIVYGETHTITRPRVEFDRDVDEQLGQDHDDDDFTGWWCVSADPFPCPADGCSFVANYATAAHRIVVFVAQDDPELLGLAGRMMKVDRNPRIVEYQRSFGPCIAYDRWMQLGRPVHGVGQHPNRKGW